MSHPKFKKIGSPDIRAVEEMAELAQAICKARRFGWLNYHPERPSTNNSHEILNEIDDVLDTVTELREFVAKKLRGRTR